MGRKPKNAVAEEKAPKKGKKTSAPKTKKRDNETLANLAEIEAKLLKKAKANGDTLDQSEIYDALSLYELDDGSRFYIEPVFYTMLKGFKDHHPELYQSIIDEIISRARKEKRVVYTGNYECPLTNVEDYIFLEITDITDPLHIFVEDKSRGSDYGD